MEHDIKKNANSENFIVDAEVVQGDIVDADGREVMETDGKAKPSFA